MRKVPKIRQAWSLEVFFDGACPLCQREIAFLRRRDRNGQIRFTDIAGNGFEPEAMGVTFDQLMGQLHGREPDGTWVTGVEVFRRLYTAAGFGPFVWLTRLPGVAKLCEVGYRHFADNRLRLTGRCQDGVCELHSAGRVA